jgi:hypothetical protein
MATSVLLQQREVGMASPDDVGETTVRFHAPSKNVASVDTGLTAHNVVDGLDVIRNMISRLEHVETNTRGIVVQTMPIEVAVSLLCQIDKMGEADRVAHVSFLRRSALAVLRQALTNATRATKRVELDSEIKRALEWAGILYFFENIQYCKLPGAE